MTHDTTPPGRKAHVILDAESRGHKARKIISLLGAGRLANARRILEIGCGSGIISAGLSAATQGRAEVHAVDVADNRTSPEGYRFHLVDSATLPFPDGHFDLVVSNYVIEHVGSAAEQAVHLAEIARVLAPGGTAYLGIPNKWRLVEPHYRLPLLSWFPQPVSDRYVRLSGRGHEYDCLPLSLPQARTMLDSAGLASRHITLRALRETLTVERPGSLLARIVDRLVPDWALALGMPIMPVYIFLLSRKQG